MATTAVRVLCFPEPRRLDRWCAEHGHPEEVVGGFFLRNPYRPLGEVRIGGDPIEHEPVSPPFGPRRGCLHVDGNVRVASHEQLGADPPGDLLQAGPLLVSEGRSLIDGEDREGFSSGAAQFDFLRSRAGDQPRRRRLRDSRPPQAPAEPALLGPGRARP